jgi:hypothetical protein
LKSKAGDSLLHRAVSGFSCLPLNGRRILPM